MQALLWGVQSDGWESPDPTNPLLEGLAKVPMRLVEQEVPEPGREWVVAKTRLAGICGSEAKQVFGEFNDTYADSALSAYFSFPVVMGHEVVAEVSRLGPEADGLETGQRVLLNPWLSCVPRGIDPPCPSCQAGDLSICWHFTEGSLAAGIHTGTCRDAPGGFADFFPAHDSMLFPVPDSIDDETAVLADPFSVSLHSVTRNPPPPGGRALVYGAGALGTTATAILRALYPEVGVMVVAGHPAQAALARSLGAEVVRSEPAEQVIEEVAAWSGGVLQPTPLGLPMAHPGGVDVVYDTVGTTETSEVAVRVLRTRGTLVKSGVNPPARWEWSPLYFKELTWVGSNAFGTEEVEGVRQHAMLHFLELVASGRVDLTGMLTHTFRLAEWRDAFAALATQDRSDAIKVAFDFR
ncbi:MAG: alcohol dehydrogenase catalytic domain-containing protein [Acidimicrobiales bacterium]|jgi:threonine dehydrogenase-like Zn-dependent dehydrogenase